MKTYDVFHAQTNDRLFSVEANSLEEAKQKAYEKYTPFGDGDYIPGKGAKLIQAENNLLIEESI